VQEPLIEVDLIPAQVNEFSNTQAVPVGQENHRVVAFAMASDTACGLPQLVDFGWREMLTRTHVAMFVALGKGELRHERLLPEELSCFRCVDPVNPESAA
jgi:hypothetical protein